MKDLHSSNVEEEIKPEPPHESLLLVLAYLPLFELLTMSKVCSSLREAVNKDVLLWLDIVVDRPLNLRITNEILAEITSKANGRLRSLVLMNCLRITDDGLLWVARRNPLLNKLYLPECTSLTPEGVITAVKTLTQHRHNLKSIKINGIYNIKKEHLEILRTCLDNDKHNAQKRHQKTYFHQRNISANTETGASIDVEECPRCNEVRTIFDCPKETCETRKKRPFLQCRGCSFCISRCEECGGCVEGEEEQGDAVCSDILCLSCWFRLPKCSFCNKPYCSRHAYLQCGSVDSVGFVCGVCQMKFF